MNRNNIKNEVEKSLKRFLKDKLKITASLLVGFLISGELSFGCSSADLALQNTVSQENLLNKIVIEKFEIQALIDVNEARLKELSKNEFELLRKGNFYSKSTDESSQIIFPVIIENSGKMKDRTNKQFKETIDDAKKYYEGNGYNLDANGDVAGTYPIPGLTPEEGVGLSYDEQIELLLKKGQGILPKINTPDIIFIDLGVNIRLLTPEIPIINVNAETRTPEVSFPILTTPTISNVTTPTTPTMPATISVVMETPTSIERVNVVEPIVTEPQILKERDLTVTTPQAPVAFDPLMIIPPEHPSTPVVNIPNTPAIDIHVVSDGNGYEVYVDNPSGNNSVISHVGVTAGEFYIKRNDNGTFGSGQYSDNYWEYKYDNYDVINIGSMAACGDIALETPSEGTYYTLTGLTTSGAYKISAQYQRGFVRQLEQYPTYINAKFVVSRAIENNDTETDEFVHMDMHGGTSAQNVADRLLEATTIAGKNIEVLGAWNDVVTNLQDISNQKSYDVIVNSGSIYLEGGNLSLNNMYDHTGSGKDIFINTGNVVLQPYNDGGTIYRGQNAVFVVSTDLYGSPHDIMYNGETGNIDVYTKDSVGYIIDSGNGYGNVNIELRNYSNYAWEIWELHPTLNSPEAYDVSGLGTYCLTFDQLFQWTFSNPYGMTKEDIPVYSTVNRGNFNLYGFGSAGIYIKNAGYTESMYFAKDTRGSITVTYDLIGVDCSANGGVPDWITYPYYGFPIVIPEYQLLKTYYPNGYPDDYRDIVGGGNINIQFVKEDGITPAPLKIYGDRSVGLYLGNPSLKTYTIYEYDNSKRTGGVIDKFISDKPIGNVTGKLYVDL
jgi:hypothetical protein